MQWLQPPHITCCHLLCSSSHSSPPCPQDEAEGCDGVGLETQSMCFHGGGEHLGLPQTSLCSATTVFSRQRKQVALSAMPRVTSDAHVGTPRVTVLGALHLPG